MSPPSTPATCGSTSSPQPIEPLLEQALELTKGAALERQVDVRATCAGIDP